MRSGPMKQKTSTFRMNESYESAEHVAECHGHLIFLLWRPSSQSLPFVCSTSPLCFSGESRAFFPLEILKKAKSPFSQAPLQLSKGKGPRPTHAER